MQSSNDHLLQIHLLEYEKLKDEQVQRIQFRDNMIFVQLGAVGGLLSFYCNSSNLQRDYALLIIPWVCIVLGWTYIANDRAISAIGRYLREELAPKLQVGASLQETPGVVLNWETFHRTDEHRSHRKNLQLGVDLVTFCASGFLGVIWSFVAIPQRTWLGWLVMIVEIVSLVVLVHQFFVHSDREVGRPTS